MKRNALVHFTDHVRGTRKGNVITGVCLSMGGGAVHEPSDLPPPWTMNHLTHSHSPLLPTLSRLGLVWHDQQVLEWATWLDLIWLGLVWNDQQV